MTLHFSETGDKIVVRFTVSKILDATRIEEIRTGLFDICNRAIGKRTLVVDFCSVQSMSSAMIGTLVLLHKRTKERDLGLRFINLTSDVFEVFKTCRLHKVFAIGNDDDDQEPIGSPVPSPKPPSTLDCRANPPPN